ncbi:hypothetical protein QRD89_13275 [Halobacillus sp. ACCC02827]|uniref:hypothetical protein n=1 Tax=Bacillaceae TaxID=186817 RepID=UPI0002A50634|nr:MULTISPECIES: hypothetical protein [Bacillaceae]ELK47347.1 hypothetical protein D479_07857 [Halobacillus sp. BAB-2008]WJE14684.1 hypothetical protein QRD89_13275 [Halobacillus sp. ACCC02827]
MLVKAMELAVLAAFSVLFAGYALFIYPLEKLKEVTSSEVKAKKLKYTPQTTEKTVA